MVRYGKGRARAFGFGSTEELEECIRCGVFKAQTDFPDFPRLCVTCLREMSEDNEERQSTAGYFIP